MVQRMTKMEDEMKMMIQLSEKFVKTFDVHAINIQTLSNIACKTTQPCEQTKTGMVEFEQEICDLKSEAEERYWHLYHKNESLALDVSHLYERLWLDVEKLIKKTDKNTKDIADCHDKAYELTQKFKRSDEKVNRVIDVVQSVTEQVFDKAITDYKTEVMKFGETHSDKGKMTIDEPL
jgi:hypothetical protein